MSNVNTFLGLACFKQPVMFENFRFNCSSKLQMHRRQLSQREKEKESERAQIVSNYYFITGFISMICVEMWVCECQDEWHTSNIYTQGCEAVRWMQEEVEEVCREGRERRGNI